MVVVAKPPTGTGDQGDESPEDPDGEAESE